MYISDHYYGLQHSSVIDVYITYNYYASFLFSEQNEFLYEYRLQLHWIQTHAHAHTHTHTHTHTTQKLGTVTQSCNHLTACDLAVMVSSDVLELNLALTEASSMRQGSSSSSWYWPATPTQISSWDERSHLFYLKPGLIQFDVGSSSAFILRTKQIFWNT